MRANRAAIWNPGLRLVPSHSSSLQWNREIVRRLPQKSDQLSIRPVQVIDPFDALSLAHGGPDRSVNEDA
jgi:hypothetical protein